MEKKKPIIVNKLIELPTGEAVAGFKQKTIKADLFEEERPKEIWGASPDFVEEKGLKKRADLTIPGGSEWGSDVTFFPPLWFSPLMSWVHFYMPRDIKTTYTWIRHWDTFDPLIGNAIDLHTQMPLSRFALKVNDPYVRMVYTNMMDMLGGLLLLYDMVREYWLFGEMFGYLYWDDEVGMFTDIQLLPPEDIIIKGNYFAQKIYLNPESFEINPDSQIDRVILEKAPDLAQAIKQKNPIPLDPFFIVSMQRKQSAYMNRGQSIILRAMKSLIYKDKLREAQYAISQRHITPKEIWTIGNDVYPATEKQIEQLRQLVQRAGQSPLFTLFTNHTVKVDYVGANGKFINFQGEYDQVEKEVLTAMFTNKAITHGEGPCVSEDTLILTEDGFKTKDEAVEYARRGGKIAQYNPETDKIEFVKPLGFMEKDFDGYMHHYLSDLVDHLVTPNHKLWVSPVGEDDWKKVRSDSLDLEKFKFLVPDRYDGLGEEVLERAKHFKLVRYKGKVYSFGVPSGLIVVMRNGKPVVTGNTYANASVAMRVLMQRYMYVRGLLETVLRDNIFLPVAVAHEFFEITEAELSHNIRRPFSERKPILPEFDWKSKANLLDTTNMVGVASQLRQLGFSHKIIADLLGIDYEEDKYWREKEEGTVFDPLYEEWRKKTMEGVPAPVGQEKTSTFKLPVIVAEREVSKDTKEPVIEEVEFTWVSRGSLLTKKHLFDYYIKPALKLEGAVPAKIVANMKPARPGSPKLVELDPITEQDIEELKRRLNREK